MTRDKYQARIIRLTGSMQLATAPGVAAAIVDQWGLGHNAEITGSALLRSPR